MSDTYMMQNKWKNFLKKWMGKKIQLYYILQWKILQKVFSWEIKNILEELDIQLDQPLAQ